MKKDSHLCNPKTKGIAKSNQVAQGSLETEKKVRSKEERELKGLKKNKKNFLQKSKKILTFAVPKQTGKQADSARLEAIQN